MLVTDQDSLKSTLRLSGGLRGIETANEKNNLSGTLYLLLFEIENSKGALTTKCDDEKGSVMMKTVVDSEFILMGVYHLQRNILRLEHVRNDLYRWDPSITKDAAIARLDGYIESYQRSIELLLAQL